jgi:hypothetical protein
MARKLMILAACAALAACSRGGKSVEAEYDVSLPLKQVMGHAVDPAAWPFWDRSGDIVDASGTHSRVPPDPTKIADRDAREAAEREWEIAENGVVQLILVSNTLKLPGYVRYVEQNDNGDWLKFAQRLNTSAHEALDAIEARDGDKMFSTGGDIYQVCSDCHKKYLLPFVDPKTGEIPAGVTEEGAPAKRN